VGRMPTFKPEAYFPWVARPRAVATPVEVDRAQMVAETSMSNPLHIMHGEGIASMNLGKVQGLAMQRRAMLDRVPQVN
jgi:hypothetical protein